MEETFLLVGIWYVKMSFDRREAKGFRALGPARLDQFGHPRRLGRLA